MIAVAPPLFGVVLVPVVCIAITQAAASGSIGRHGGAGIRTKKTLASDAAWVAGHQAALPIIQWTGVVAAFSVVAALLVQLWLGGQAGVFIALGGMLAEVVILLFSSKAAGVAASKA